jgi:hypothetical protein
MSFSEHSEQKDKLVCQECHQPLTQSVARLRFKLTGNGWFANEYGGGSGPGSGYEITQTELNNNLEEEKRVEEKFYNDQATGRLDE